MSTTEVKRAEVCRQQLEGLGQSIGAGLSLTDLSSVEQSIGRELPTECRAILRAFGEVSINADYAAVLAQESPVGELLFLDMLPAMDWAKSTQWCKGEWSYFEDGLASDPPQVSGFARPVLIDKNRVLISMAHGIFWFLDFAPIEGGRVGQVIAVYPMPQDHHVLVIAPDLISFFEQVVASLTAK